MVDLIILIDCSGSMSSKATDISNQADSAIKLALLSCPSNLRVSWFGQDGTWNGTKFTQNYKTYLTALGVTPMPANNEQGAIGIQDLSNNFDWRDGACRAIFYISDEPINSVWDSTANGTPTADAIIQANNNSVTVSAHFQTQNNIGSWLQGNYQDVTSQTNGELFTSNTSPLPSGFYANNQVFDKLICNACNNCKFNIRP